MGDKPASQEHAIERALYLSVNLNVRCGRCDTVGSSPYKSVRTAAQQLEDMGWTADLETGALRCPGCEPIRRTGR